MLISPWVRRALVVALLASGWLAWEFQGKPDVEVSTSTVTAGPITRHIVATGTLQAVTTVDVGTQVSGIVQSLEADYNSPVHVGQIIARLNPSSSRRASARGAGRS